MGVIVINTKLTWTLSGVALFCSAMAVADGWVPIVAPGQTAYQTKASLNRSIANTRHNLTQSFNPSASIVMTVAARNNYGEICVYCHTPHGANSQVKAPIWNRTINTGEYIIYDKLRTLNRPIGQPGANSLTCLSCHDGTIAIDSIINMPGSGGYNSGQQATVDKGWLNTWPNRGLPGPDGAPPTLISSPSMHAEMGNEYPSSASQTPPTSQTGKCALCHFEDTALPDFRVFVIGTDLRNDHPIGILFPDTFGAGTGVDFNQPTGSVVGKMKYFDKNGNSHPDTNEPRLYDTGEGPEVECASCHDPHGIPVNGPGTQFIPSFLRVSNGNANSPGDGSPSGLCLTCHDK